jgi:DNA polymerase-3 subunit epsilon
MERHGIKWSSSGARLLDGLRLWQVGSPRTLTDALEEFCGRKPTEAHRALGDAEDALDVVTAMLERFPKLPRDIQKLHDSCFVTASQADPDNRLTWVGKDLAINFGKHNGTLLHQVPIGYLKWMLDGSFSPEVKTILINWLEGGALPTRKE